MADFAMGAFVVPSDGYEYKLGFSFGLSGAQERYCFGLSSGRWMLAGDIVTTAAYSYAADGNFSMGWIEA
jgi:hypothetical protein